MKQQALNLVVDYGSYDNQRRRKVRPSRHVSRGDVLACGHKGLPKDGELVQIPISFRALLQVTDCPTCQNYLRAQAAYKVIKRSLGK